ncbi:MAG: phage adaptor protein [Rhizomicrobium sp.]
MALDGTYGGLEASIADWLNRADLTATIPDFIAAAEAQMSRRLLKDGPVRPMLARVDTTITAEFVNVPADFMGVNTIYITGAPTASGLLRLQMAAPAEMNDLKSFQFEVGDSLQRFAVVGASFQFWPWTGGSVPAELTYWQRIPALAQNIAGNWLSASHPDAYLYGALLQAAPYLKDDGRVPMWSEAFETILSDIVAADKIERGAAELAMPPRIVA